MKLASIALILAIVFAVPALAWNDGFDGWNDGFDGWNDGFDGWNDGFDGWNDGFDGSDGSDGNDQNSNDWNNNGGTPPNNDWTPPIPNPNPFVNQPPVLNAIGPRTVFEGQLLSFAVSGSDPDGQSISFSASNLPSGASFSGQTFSWTPNFNQQGQYIVNFVVTDSMGAQDSEAVQITVLDVNVPPPPVVNNAPVFLSQPVTSAYIREWYFSQVIVFDQDGNNVNLNLATAPVGMQLRFVEQGYTVFGNWIDDGDSDSEQAITGDTFTVTVHDITQTACDVTINDRRMTFQEDVNYLITLGNGVQYQVNVEPDFDFGDCYVEITDNRVTTGWLMWLPEPNQQGSNPVSITASDGIATTTQNFSVLVTVDPRTLPKPDQPRGPKKDIRVNTIVIPEEARAGEFIVVTLNFENSGDLKLDGAEATISIPELGIRSPTIGPLDLRINKDVSRTLTLEIPEDASDGFYTVRLTIDSGSVHRIVHRDIEIVSD